MQIEMGKKYRTAEGEMVSIDSAPYSDPHLFRGNFKRGPYSNYTIDGRAGCGARYNIVAEWPTPVFIRILRFIGSL